MTSLSSVPGKTQSGFVLILVIWVIAGLSLMVAFVASQVDDLQTLAFKNEALVQQRLDRQSIKWTLLYLASTRTNSHSGIRTEVYVPPEVASLDVFDTDPFVVRGDELRLDGRLYQAQNKTLFRLQDAGSLVSLRSDRLVTLRALIEHYGISRSRTERLLATLSDYTDRDQIASLNGAERNGYERASMLPPTDRFLSSPMQLYNVMDWPAVLDEYPSLIEELTIYVGDWENYNSMTPTAIIALTPNDERETRRIVAARDERTYRGIGDVFAVSGSVYPRDALSTTFVPSRYIRLTISDSQQSKAYRIGITLTPDSNLAPWEIDYAISWPLTADLKNDIARLEPEAPPTTLL